MGPLFGPEGKVRGVKSVVPSQPVGTGRADGRLHRTAGLGIVAVTLQSEFRDL